MGPIVLDASVGARIALMVPTNHLNGGLKMEMDYTIYGTGYANNCTTVTITPWYQNQDEPAKSVAFAPTGEVVTEMKKAIDYFAYVRLHLQHEKTHPASFGEWVARGQVD